MQPSRNVGRQPLLVLGAERAGAQLARVEQVGEVGPDLLDFW